MQGGMPSFLQLHTQQGDPTNLKSVPIHLEYTPPGRDTTCLVCRFGSGTRTGLDDEILTRLAQIVAGLSPTPVTSWCKVRSKTMKRTEQAAK